MLRRTGPHPRCHFLQLSKKIIIADHSQVLASRHRKLFGQLAISYDFDGWLSFGRTVVWIPVWNAFFLHLLHPLPVSFPLEVLERKQRFGALRSFWERGRQGTCFQISPFLKYLPFEEHFSDRYVTLQQQRRPKRPWSSFFEIAIPKSFLSHNIHLSTHSFNASSLFTMVGTSKAYDIYGKSWFDRFGPHGICMWLSLQTVPCQN